MPPFLPRKRLRTASPESEAGPSAPPTKKTKPASAPRKPTLFDDLDAGTSTKRTANHKKAALEKLAASGDDGSSLSSLSEDDFEDVQNAKRAEASEDEDEDEDIEFEDVDTNAAAPGASENIPTGDLELTLTKDTRISITNPLGTKKGPSKIERQIRISTHQMHVQFLMLHNAIRNSWLCDKELQAILVNQLPSSISQAVEKWKQDSGLDVKATETPKGKGNGKRREKASKGKQVDPRSQRDWGEPAQQQAKGQVNMSGGDPLFRLLRILVNFWKQRFRTTAPGLRKLGYLSLQRIDEELKSFRDEKHDPERHGERFENLEQFRENAKTMEGSRDFGAQLFTALLRGLGVESRMVASLQPVGFGWSQGEEAFEKNPRALKKRKSRGVGHEHSNDEDDSASEIEKPPPSSAEKGKGKAPAKPRRKSQATGSKDSPMDLDPENSAAESDNESVIDITPVKPRTQPSLPYDKDLEFPHYWTEVLSPVTNTYTPVDAVVKATIATNQRLIESFESRGARSEKAKQVTAYIIGHSSDGTAKDVTTRYLKAHMWPGRTKGFRYPAGKIPIHDRKGKVKRYELKDWFKTVMSGYVRGSKKCPRTEIDDHEDSTDLKPAKREKKEVEEGKETLQYYKTSAEFVLERHLRREEAILPPAKHVKMFSVGKGDSATQEKVFLRKDVVKCKTMETWHKEGRAPKDGEEPLKRVPYRAATTNRKRELAEAEHMSGEKMLQGLYSEAQTDWIIPPPIENGIIPKNSFGNIDLYVDSMLPEGAAHIPYRGTVKICKRLGIDYAEAVTGFEFGHRMAVPVITGVVIPDEYFDSVMEEWHKDEEERERKEDEKRRKTALNLWRKMLMGLRIVERVREEYGDAADEEDVLNPFHNKSYMNEDADAEVQKRIMDQQDEEMAGGFLAEGLDVEDNHVPRRSTFFPMTHEDEDEEEGAGGFVVEEHDDPKRHSAYPTPQSLGSQPSEKITQGSKEDIEIDEAPKVETSAPKKRVRPFSSAKKSTFVPATSKSKTPAKRSTTSKYEGEEAGSEADEEGILPAFSDLDLDVVAPNGSSTKKSSAIIGAAAKAKTKTPTTRVTPLKGKMKFVGSQLDGADDQSPLSELDTELNSDLEGGSKGSLKKSKVMPRAALAKSKTPKSRTPASKRNNIVQESEEEEEEEDGQPSDSESEEIIKPPPKKRGRPSRASAASSTPKSEGTRKTPKRATKKNETALRSKYFELNDDLDDVE